MYLSEVVGKSVEDSAGKTIGRLADLVVTPGEQFPPVSAIIVKLDVGGKKVLPWSQVMEVEELFTLSITDDKIRDYEIQENDLLLQKDVLDKQIVDVHDYRIVRVNDVRLAPLRGQLFLMGVDTGLRGLLRRFGIDHLAESVGRIFKWRPHTHIIAWDDVETFERSGGKIKLKVPAERLSKLHPADIARIINEMDPAQRAEVIESLDVETAADTLAEADDEVQVSILENLEDERAADILEEMEPDEAADLLGDLSADRREELLSEMEAEEAEDVKELLTYDEATAGGLMTTEYIPINKDMTAQQVIDRLREIEPEAETVYYVYVIDEEEHLVGVISLRDLITAAPDKRVEDFMVSNVIHVHLDANIEEIAQTMERYNLLALPVVDDENRIQGIVTVDDALEQILPEEWKERVPKLWSR
ncbi:MAG: CBS domain-containing protein [Armatimonadota bacterium]|nr:CBS domain-containing protein [Armatimonadota bacterium]